MNREEVEKLVIEQIRFLTKENHSGSELSGENNIKEVGLDSLDVVELLMEVEEQYKISISDDAIQECQTISDVVDLILASSQEK